MGLPGLQRVDHIGFTVPDLAEARAFLVDVLGCEYLYSLGPFEHPDSDWMAEHLAVHPRTVMRRNEFFRLGDQVIFEVFCYEAPDQATTPPRNSDIGGHHVALYVDDLDSAIDHLRAHGVRVLAGPTPSSGAHEGQRWIYFLSPWGMQFELVSYPHGKAWHHHPERFS
jgi:glyoxylase I family protein